MFVFEVFIMLTLFCDGLLNEKVRWRRSQPVPVGANLCVYCVTMQVEFIFKLFDLDGKGYLTEVRVTLVAVAPVDVRNWCWSREQTDMLLLLQSLTFAAKKVGITKTKPSAKELHALTKEMVLCVAVLGFHAQPFTRRVAVGVVVTVCVCVCVCVCVVLGFVPTAVRIPTTMLLFRPRSSLRCDRIASRC